MKKTEFYFDFLSPYSYFAWKNHKSIIQAGHTDFIYRPVIMGQLFSKWNITGPGEIPPKRYLMLKSCFRYADREGIQFTPPAQHPFNPLYALRLATNACAQAEQFKVIEALWDYIWARGNPGDDPDAIEAYLASQGIDAKELMEKSFSREAKLELKKNTKDAIEAKIFGVPSMVYQGELFWGNDSLADLVRHIKGECNYDKSLFEERTKDIEW